MDASLSRICLVSCFLLLATFFHHADAAYEALYPYSRDKFFSRSEILGVKPKVHLPIPVRYYGQLFETVYISKDGLLGFDPDIGFSQNQWRNGLPELSVAADKPFISPFHHNGLLRSGASQRYTGRIYHDLYTRHNPDDQRTVDRDREEFMKDTDRYLSLSAVTVTDFKSDFLLLVTWENVTSLEVSQTRGNDSCDATNDHPCRSATFQVLLAANATTTFVIFNYAKMDLPFEPSHLAGMNGGGGRGWTDVVKCSGACSKKRDQRIMSSLPYLKGSDESGRYIFLVSDDVIIRGGCAPSDSKVSSVVHAVEVYPRKVEMLGGEVIEVSGRCQTAYSTVYCRFDGKEVTEGRMTSAMRGRCHVPRLTSRGQVKLEVSDNRNDWHVYTFINVIPPDHVERLRDREDMRPWFDIRPTQLTVSWDPHQLYENQDARVDIVIVGYRERYGQVEWKDNLIKLAEEEVNSGDFVFDPREYRFRCETGCQDFELGVLEIRLSEDYKDGARDRRFYSIGPLTLGWYVDNIFTDWWDENWPRDKCKKWAREDETDIRWLNNLLSCPCTLQQALADWGQYQPVVGCSMFKANSKCLLNKGAKHCVLSVQPSSDGAATRCCYGADNLLMNTADSYAGSASNRAHPWGVAPYGAPGAVPTMSHWVHDMVPYAYCCQWGGDDTCKYYMDRRPTKSCRDYWQPGSATIYGDPHVTTFDGRSYYFGGAGDFWLVKSPGLHVQARFTERIIDSLMESGTQDVDLLHPTVITSVIVAAPDSEFVTFTLAPPSDVISRRLNVKVIGRHFFFNKENLMWQDFKGFSVVNNKLSAQDEADRHHSNFTVLMKNGAGVQVAERNGLLNIVVILPPYDETSSEPASRGLLGTWDDNSQNDFMTSVVDNAFLPATEVANERRLYQDFGRKWGVAERESHFQFPLEVDLRRPRTGSGREINPSDYPTDGEVTAICGDTDNACARDYYVTGNRTVALDTKKAAESFESLKLQQRKMWSCGLLNIPFAEKDNHNYTAGNVVRVTGCRQGPGSAGQVVEGPTYYTCIQNETDHQPFWDPEVNYYACLDIDEANIGMIVGIAVACAVVLIIAIVAIVFLVRRRKKGSKSVSGKRGDTEVEPGTEETLLKGKEQGGDRIYRMSDMQERERGRSEQV